MEKIIANVQQKIQDGDYEAALKMLALVRKPSMEVDELKLSCKRHLSKLYLSRIEEAVKVNMKIEAQEYVNKYEKFIGRDSEITKYDFLFAEPEKEKGGSSINITLDHTRFLVIAYLCIIGVSSFIIHLFRFFEVSHPYEIFQISDLMIAACRIISVLLIISLYQNAVKVKTSIMKILLFLYALFMVAPGDYNDIYSEVLPTCFMTFIERYAYYYYDISGLFTASFFEILQSGLILALFIVLLQKCKDAYRSTLVFGIVSSALVVVAAFFTLFVPLGIFPGWALWITLATALLGNIGKYVYTILLYMATKKKY